MEKRLERIEPIPAGDLTESKRRISDEQLRKIEELSLALTDTIGGGFFSYHYALPQ